MLGSCSLCAVFFFGCCRVAITFAPKRSVIVSSPHRIGVHVRCCSFACFEIFSLTPLSHTHTAQQQRRLNVPHVFLAMSAFSRVVFARYGRHGRAALFRIGFAAVRRASGGIELGARESWASAGCACAIKPIHRARNEDTGTGTTIDHTHHISHSVTFSASSLYHTLRGICCRCCCIAVVVVVAGRLDKGRAGRSRSRSRALSPFAVVDVVLFRGHCTIMIESARASTICIRAHTAADCDSAECSARRACLPAPVDTATRRFSAEPPDYE